MSDLYLKFVNTPLGKSVVQSLSLPSPVELERWRRPDQPFVEGHILLGAGPDPIAMGQLADTIVHSPATLYYPDHVDSLDAAVSLANSHHAIPLEMENIGEQRRFKALVFDATGITEPTGLRCLYDFFHPTIRQIARCGRILIIGLNPRQCETTAQAAAQKALEGFIRSVGKEIGKKGATAQLIHLEPGAEDQLDTALRFFLSPRSAFVSGQVITVSKRRGQGPKGINTIAPLTGKVALVTGASRGIGEAIARVLARDGAKVVCLDVPAAMASLDAVARSIEGLPLAADITEDNAPGLIADFLEDNFKGVDLVVHNAGITRDKTLGRMPDHFWDLTIAVNLMAEERINDALFDRKLIRKDGRIVCVSSMSGIAGNFGQTNYAASKSGVIGYVEALAPRLKNGVTVNAVAPGFIETQMTAAMPITLREAGRRMNSLSQGGLPADVAEAINFFCHPLAGGVNGNILRVCGQNLIGR